MRELEKSAGTTAAEIRATLSDAIRKLRRGEMSVAETAPSLRSTASTRRPGSAPRRRAGGFCRQRAWDLRSGSGALPFQLREGGRSEGASATRTGRWVSAGQDVGRRRR